MSEVCYTPRDLQNLRTFNIWAAIAGLAFVAASLSLSKGFVERGPLAWTIVTATIVLLLLMVRAYIHFIRDTDELQRKIQLDGCALGFAAGVVFMLGYRLLERLGAPKVDIADGVIPMVVCWALGQYIGYRRYFLAGAKEEQ